MYQGQLSEIHVPVAPRRAQRIAFQCHPLRGAYAALTRPLRAIFLIIFLIAASESASTLTSMIGELIQKRDLNKKHEISKHLFCFGQFLRAAYATLRAPVFLMRHACAQLTQPYAHQRFG